MSQTMIDADREQFLFNLAHCKADIIHGRIYYSHAEILRVLDETAAQAVKPVSTSGAQDGGESPRLGSPDDQQSVKAEGLTAEETALDRQREIAERLAKISPGPWDITSWRYQDAHIDLPNNIQCRIHASALGRDIEQQQSGPARKVAKFIVHAPADIDFLLKEVTRLRSLVKE